MAFVLLLILSISTLVQVEVASSNTSIAQLKAEQAALLSLNVAIGKLQETAGLDQRVTAPAQSAGRTEVGAKQLTGVWRSWEGRDHQANGVPIVPDYASKQVEGDLAIDSSNAGRFLGWLVSSTYDPVITPDVEFDNPPRLTEVAGVTIPLVGAGTVGIDADGIANQVHAEPTSFDDDRGAYAWWISGENTKSLLDVPVVSNGIFESKDRLSSSSQPDVGVFEITDGDALGKVSNRNSLNQIPNNLPIDERLSSRYFHDLTAYAHGLLTNTATGGWRRDLSLMSEQWGNSGFPNNALPFFTLRPGVETAAGKASANGATSAGNLVYPWSVESIFDANGGAGNNTGLGGASVSWDALVDFTQQYRKVTSIDSSGRVSMPLEAINPRDAIPRRPVIARVHWVFSFMSRPDTDDPAKLRAYILASPVMTLWNPYNVAIEGYDNFWVRFLAPTLPVSFQFTVGNETQSEFYGVDRFAGDNRLTFRVSADTSEWAPGESRVYSATSTGGDSGRTIDLGLGYRTDGGARYGLYKTYGGGRYPTTSGPLVGEPGDAFTVDFQKEDSTAFKVEVYGSNFAEAELLYSVPKATSDPYFGDLILGNDDETLGSVQEAVEFPEPFLVTVMQLRNSTVRSTDTKGYFNAKPNLYFTSNKYERLEAYPYDWVFYTPNDTNGSDALPQAGGSDNDSGYVGTSFRPDVGLSRSVVYEVPTRPLRSLGELQHFDVNYYSPLPPFIANPIGNSHASYLIAPDAIAISGSEADNVRATYDHSYVANHLFFDDWFVSSIAPEMVDGSTALARDTQDVYEGFVLGASKLPNQSYVPAAAVTATDAGVTILDDVNAWHGIASKIEVNGMFNVNSTSVEAWAALLGHINGGDVPYISQSADAWSVQLESGLDDEHPVSRTTVAGDPSANPDSVVSQIGTHARLSKQQIEELAVQIVEQVKQRGPFLSLSEFVNRQLTNSNVDLSRAGAIEAALIALSELGTSSKNPYSNIQNTFLNPDTGAVDIVDSVGKEPRAFPEAAVGNVSYGFPGWVRQADVLRPIAPVLSARDDTFVIRAYGESKNPISGKTDGRSWCEAVVQRRADYVDPADAATVLPSDATLNSDVNKRFGRRFSIVSFRWLSPEEV